MMCPNCQAEKFYLEKSEQLRFVHVSNDLVVTVDHSGWQNFSVDGSEILHCSQCAWAGTITELSMS